MKRGVIGTVGRIRPITGGFHFNGQLSKQDIRYYLMYYDEVVIPDNNLFSCRLHDEDVLIECGVVSRPRVVFEGAFEGDAITHAVISSQSIIAQEIFKKSNDDWVLHQFGDDISLLSDECTEKNVLRFELANCLPVPNEDTSIYDILEFRARYSSEFQALHETLDELYFEILKSPDQDLSQKTVIAKFRRSVRDLMKSSSEVLECSTTYERKLECSISEETVRGMACGALAGALVEPLSCVLGAFLGGIGSSIKLNVGSTRTYTPAEGNSKLQYLSKASNQELIS